MTASHSQIHTTAAAATAPRATRRARGPLLALGLLCALLAGCGPQATAPSASGDSGDRERFVFLRARLGLVRVDTSNGQVWTVPVNGDGGWVARGAAPDLAGEAARNGRFNVMNVPMPRNAPRQGQADAPVIMRVDRATGRTWLLESEDATSWVMVGDSGQDPVAEPAAPSQPAAAASSTPSAQPSASAGTPDAAYPILTGDQLGTTPEEKKRARGDWRRFWERDR